MTIQKKHVIGKSQISRGKAKRQAKKTDNGKAVYWPYLLIIVSGFLLYGNTLQNDYALDDVFSITSNQYTMQGISGIPQLISTNYFSGFLGDEQVDLAGGRYRPLSLITFALEVEAFGARPGISHFINIILYILLGILLFRAFSGFIKPHAVQRWYMGIAFLSVLLFMFHPVHTEVVANIKGRDEIMVFLFSILSLNMVHRQVKSGKPIYHLFAFLLFFLALMSKENALTFLLIIPLTLYFFSNYNTRKILLASLPLLAATAIFLFIRFSVLEGTGAKPSQNLMDNPFLEASLSQRYGTIFYTLGKYIQLLVFPHPLTWDYYPYHIVLKKFFSLSSLLPLVLYVAGGIYALYSLPKKSILSYVLLFWFITLSVASNVFVNIGAFMAERFLFIPSFAFCLAAAYFIIEKLPGIFKTISTVRITIIVILPLLILYSFKTIDRNRDWKNNFTLYTTDVETSPNSAKGNNIAGQFYAYEAVIASSHEKKLEYNNIALKKLKKAIAIYPAHADALFHTGNVHYNLYANIDSLVKYYCRVLKILPEEEKVFKNLNTALKKENDTIVSIRAYTAIAKVVPGNYNVNYELTRLYGGQNNYDSTLKYAEAVLGIRPDDLKMMEYAAYIYFSIEEYEKSMDYYENLHRANPGNKTTLQNLISVCSRLGKNDEMIVYQNKLKALNMVKDKYFDANHDPL